MDAYVFTKRHVVNACLRVCEKGRRLAAEGDISQKEGLGYSAAALAFAEEMGVREEYVNGESNQSSERSTV